MATRLADIASSGPIGWNATGRTWRLSDLFSFIPGPTVRLSVTSSQPFIVPTPSGRTNPPGFLQVGFTIDTSNAPPGGWNASNMFTLTITLDDGQGVATNTLTTNLVVVAPPVIANPIRDWTLPPSASNVLAAHLPSVFHSRGLGTNPDLSYSVPSASGGVTATIDSSSNLLLSTGATAQDGTVVVECTATSASGAPATLSQNVQDSFSVETTEGAPATLTPGGIPTLFMREGETVEYDVASYFTGADPRVEMASAGSPLTVGALGSILTLTAAAPTGNKQDATVTLSVLADDGVPVDTTFVVSVLKATVRFDFGIPSVSVTVRTLSVRALSKTLFPSTPYAGAVESYLVEARNSDTAIMTRATSLPATIALPRGGEWEVRARMFLDGFPSRQERSVFVHVPERAVGSIAVSAGTAIDVVFDYGAGAVVEDVSVKLYGDDLYSYTPDVSNSRVSVTPPEHGLYEVVVEATVNEEAITYTENILFGTPETRVANGMSVTLDGNILPVERVQFGGGVRRLGGALPVLWSQRGEARLYSDEPLSSFIGREVRVYLGHRLAATLWVDSARERLGVRREVRLSLFGRMSHSGAAHIDHAETGASQSEALSELCRQASVPCRAHQVGAMLPAHKSTENFASAVRDLEGYGEGLFEDRYGRIALGSTGMLPVKLGYGVDTSDTAAVEENETPNQMRPFNAVDVPIRSIGATGQRVASTVYNGDGIGLETTIWTGFDLSQYLPDATTHTMTRAGTKAAVAPALDGARLVGLRYAEYDGPDRLRYTVAPAEERVDVLPGDMPRFYSDAASALASATDLLSRARAERVEVSVVAPSQSQRLDVISQVFVGGAIEYAGSIYRVDSSSMSIEPGVVRAAYVLVLLRAAPVVPSNVLIYDSGDTWDSGKVWGV